MLLNIICFTVCAILGSVLARKYRDDDPLIVSEVNETINEFFAEVAKNDPFTRKYLMGKNHVVEARDIEIRKFSLGYASKIRFYGRKRLLKVTVVIPNVIGYIERFVIQGNHLSIDVFGEARVDVRQIKLHLNTKLDPDKYSIRGCKGSFDIERVKVLASGTFNGKEITQDTTYTISEKVTEYLNSATVQKFFQNVAAECVFCTDIKTNRFIHQITIRFFKFLIYSVKLMMNITD